MSIRSGWRSIVLLLLASPLAAQSASWSGSPAAAYLDRYEEIGRMQPAVDQAATVTHLVLQRDVGEMVLESGTLFLLTPVGGQVMGAVFTGKGQFNFTPSIAIERERLKTFRKTTSLEEPFTQAVFIFADKTLDQLQRELTFGPGKVPGALKQRLAECLDYLGDKDEQSLDPDVMRALLNGERTGLFYAHMARDNADPWMFMINPHELESVQLLARAKRTGFTRYSESVVQFPRQDDTIRTGGRAERRPEARVQKYTMAVRLPQTGTGEVAFSAAATLDVTADTLVGPWVSFYLFPKVGIDSARWDNGDPAVSFKGKDSPILWIRLNQPLAPGAVKSIRIYYHGDLIDRFGDWFFIKSSISWYPVALDTRQVALFDLTFDSPQGFSLASVGELRDSAMVPGHMVRSHWITPDPIRNASFNLGNFEVFQVADTGVPPVTVLWSDAMHRAISQGGQFTRGRNMKQQVGEDVASAIKFYTHVFGDPPMTHFYVTETPTYHGEAWPGIVGLSFVTFQQTDQSGEDEVFRAHEVAHQWWGIGVDYATYRDRWLSEGFSDFSGLWYLQARRKDPKKYFDILDRWRASIMLRRDDPLPIWLGHRVATASTSEDYQAVIYDKGAWVLHMLRMLMLDLKTMNEDRFTGMMREYWSTYRGRSASTADFQRVVEHATGQKMGWFFDEWVYQSGIPTYRYAWHAEQEGESWKVKLRVEQERVPPEFLMYVPVSVDLGHDQAIRARVKVTGQVSNLELPPMPAKPKSVRFNDLHGVLADVTEVPW
jgi:hypothetical protein